MLIFLWFLGVICLKTRVKSAQKQIVNFSLIFRIPPEELNESPNNIWLYIYQGFYPPFLVCIMTALFLIKNPSLRSELKRLFGY